MKNLSPTENFLKGNWVKSGSTMVGDDITKRIDFLIKSILKKIDASPDGWNTLYQDPADGRYWEHLYLESEMHGGGPPSLKLISLDDAKKKYALK